MLQKQTIYVTGLPQSGSTLLCQLLGHHPDIYSTGYSSPLCQTLTGLRFHLSDSNVLLAQIDSDFPLAYQRLINAFRGFINGWFAETDQNWVVDQSRDWLNHLDMLHLLDPNCRLLVCVRELGQVYGSIEAQHQKTLLLDFSDHLAGLSVSERAIKLFADDGVVGKPLKAIESVQDMNEHLQKRLYYVVFEHLISDPLDAMQGIYDWLGLLPSNFNPQQLPVSNHESDSYNRFKDPHQTYSQIQPPTDHLIPKRFNIVLKQRFAWFYETFYPGLL